MTGVRGSMVGSSAWDERRWRSSAWSGAGTDHGVCKMRTMAIMPQNRGRRCGAAAVLKWTGAGVCGAIFGIWFASGWIGFDISHHTKALRFVGVYRGCLVIGRIPESFAPQGWNVKFLGPAVLYPLGTSQSSRWFWRANRTPARNRARQDAMQIPLYIPFAIVAVPCASQFAWDWRRTRRRQAGGCTQCGYDLAGNTTGVCPECGNGAAA